VREDPDRPALVVAVDGPSGSGKSTTAREVARRLGYRYVDTGSMYRAVTRWLLDRGVDVTDAATVAGLVGDPATAPVLLVTTDPDQPGVVVDGRDVTGHIRDADVTAAVSAVSAVAEVRALLVRIQREIAASGGAVLEGRDIGTTVVPDAAVKVFLTADVTVRASRRSAELPGVSVHSAEAIAATQADLARRDYLDSSRVESPLSQADDAVEIDSTGLSVDEVAQRVLDLVVAHEGQVEAEPR
jgi:CMP/dCMP kinase